MTRRFHSCARLAVGVALLGLAACGGSASADQRSTTAAASTKNRVATSTKPGLKQASWGSNVTITYGKGYVRYRSNGIPNHSRPAQYALPNAGVRVPTAATATAGADPTTAQSYDFKITTNPKKASKRTSTSLGAIGVMISGAALFNPYEGDASTVAAASNFTVKGDGGTDVAFLDSCNGHPTPMGTYHYHALPACITAKVDKQNGPSHIIGIAFDGYPIYGDRDVKGRKVGASKLDRCNGITSATPEFPRGIYHYVLPDAQDSRSSIRCFTGKVSSSLTNTNAMPGMGPPPPGAAGVAGASATLARGTAATSSATLVCELAHASRSVTAAGATLT